MNHRGLCLISGVVAWLATRSRGEMWAWSILATLMGMLVRWRLVGHVEWDLLRGLAGRSALRLLRPPAWAGLRNRATRNAPRATAESPSEAPSMKLYDPLVLQTPEESIPGDASSTASAPVATDVLENKPKKAA